MQHTSWYADSLLARAATRSPTAIGIPSGPYVVVRGFAVSSPSPPPPSKRPIASPTPASIATASISRRLGRRSRAPPAARAPAAVVVPPPSSSSSAAAALGEAPTSRGSLSSCASKAESASAWSSPVRLKRRMKGVVMLPETSARPTA